MKSCIVSVVSTILYRFTYSEKILDNTTITFRNLTDSSSSLMKPLPRTWVSDVIQTMPLSPSYLTQDKRNLFTVLKNVQNLPHFDLTHLWAKKKPLFCSQFIKRRCDNYIGYVTSNDCVYVWNEEEAIMDNAKFLASAAVYLRPSLSLWRLTDRMSRNVGNDLPTYAA